MPMAPTQPVPAQLESSGEFLHYQMVGKNHKMTQVTTCARRYSKSVHLQAPVLGTTTVREVLVLPRNGGSGWGQ